MGQNARKQARIGMCSISHCKGGDARDSRKVTLRGTSAGAAAVRGALHPAVLEALEHRQLMSSVAFADGVLTIDAAGDRHLNALVTLDSEANRIRVTASNSRFRSFPR